MQELMKKSLTGSHSQSHRRYDMTRLQEVEKLLDTNLQLIAEYTKRVAELIGSVRVLEKERDKLTNKSRRGEDGEQNE